MSTIETNELAERPQDSNSGSPLYGFFQCGIIVVDNHNTLSLLTKTAAGLTNIVPKRGQMLDSLPQMLLELIGEARSKKQPILEQTIRLPHPDNGSLTLLVSVLPDPSQSSTNTPAVTVLLQDVGAAQQFEKNLQRLDRLANIGILAAGVAHEIKNALVVGKTFFDLLLERHKDADLTQLVQRELMRIDSLVSQMLRFTSPAKPAFADIQLQEVLDHSLLMVKRQLQDKAIELNQSYAAPSDLVHGDKLQLEQAFVNLLLNAIEAMGPRGRLLVATKTGQADKTAGVNSTAPTQVQILIQDSGVGIPAENINHLFDPFFTTKSGGTGLGLSITRRTIEEHGGKISVKSKPGEGTCFQIMLPVVKPA